MVNRNDTNTSFNTVINDLSKDTEALNLTNSNFQFAIRVSNYATGSLTQNDSYFSINLKQYEITDNQETSQDIGLSLWGDRFNYEFSRSNIAQEVSTTFLCPDSYDFQIQGDNFASIFKYVQLQLNKWENGTGIQWESQTNIDNAVNQINIQILVVNSYFDFEDFNNPLKTYIEDKLQFFAINGTKNNVELYFQENESEKQDNYFLVYPPTKEGKVY